MGIVLQQGYLFSGSVMDNLRFRRPELEPDADALAAFPGSRRNPIDPVSAPVPTAASDEARDAERAEVTT